MKKFFATLALCLAIPISAIAADTPETKKVCMDVIKDGKPVKNKDGSTKQQCKDVKIHKKHEGTRVPEKK